MAGGFPGSRTTKTWRFTVDTKGPTIAFDPPGVLIPRGHPLALAGTLEPGATLTANGRPVLVQDGRFRIAWTTRPTGAVTLVATDTLRNTSTQAGLDLDEAAHAGPSRSGRCTSPRARGPTTACARACST